MIITDILEVLFTLIILVLPIIIWLSKLYYLSFSFRGNTIFLRMNIIFSEYHICRQKEIPSLPNLQKLSYSQLFIFFKKDDLLFFVWRIRSYSREKRNIDFPDNTRKNDHILYNCSRNIFSEYLEEENMVFRRVHIQSRWQKRHSRVCFYLQAVMGSVLLKLQAFTMICSDGIHDGVCFYCHAIVVCF